MINPAVFRSAIFVLMAILCWTGKPVFSAPQTAGEMLEMAEADLELAHELYDSEENYASACLKAHDAVAKALKGAIMMQDKIPGDIPLTADLASQLSVDFPELRTVIGRLRDFDRAHRISRNTAAGGGQISSAEAEECLDVAEDTYEFLEERI